MDPQLSDTLVNVWQERSFSLAGFSHLVVPTPSSTERGLVSRLGLVPCVASSCRWGGGDAVVLDGMRLRPRTYRGGTSSWTHPCSWTQRQLSITVYGRCADGLCSVSKVREHTCANEKPTAAPIKGKYLFYFKIPDKKTTTEMYGENTNQCCIHLCSLNSSNDDGFQLSHSVWYLISFILGHIQDWLNMVCTFLQASFMQGKTANARILHSAPNYFKYHRGPVHQYKWR